MKIEVVGKIKGKSFDETEEILARLFPHAKKRESLRSIDGEDSRLSLNLEKEAVSALKRVRELLSHTLPNATWGDLVAYIAKDYLRRKDPVHKKTDSVKRRVKSRAACEFQDPVSGRICGSRYQLEVDHIIPRAHGGTDEPENLRALCRQHNLYEAKRKLGSETMAPYLKPTP